MAEILSHDAKPAQRWGVSVGAGHKGQQTRAAILDAALSLASQMGIEGLSIGALAEVTGMSKSGVFAHFGSREELQISVIREYHARFADEVFLPAIREPRGLPACRPCSPAGSTRWPPKLILVAFTSVVRLNSTIVLARCVTPWSRWFGPGMAPRSRHSPGGRRGDLRPDTDPMQMLFEIHGLILSLHHDARFCVRRARWIGPGRLSGSFSLCAPAQAPVGAAASGAANVKGERSLATPL